MEFHRSLNVKFAFLTLFQKFIETILFQNVKFLSNLITGFILKIRNEI